MVLYRTKKAKYGALYLNTNFKMYVYKLYFDLPSVSHCLQLSYLMQEDANLVMRKSESVTI